MPLNNPSSGGSSGGSSTSYQFPYDAPPSNPDSWNDEFTGSFNSSKWTWANQGTAVATCSNSYLQISDVAASSAHQMRIITQAVTGSWTITAKIGGNCSFANYMWWGLVLGDAAGKYIAFNYVTNATLVVLYFTNATTYGSTPVTYNLVDQQGFMRIQYNGSQFIFSISRDGIYFHTLYTVSSTAHFAAAPTKAGLVMNPYSIPGFLTCDYIRLTVP